MTKRKKRRAPVPEPEAQPVVRRSTRIPALWERERAETPTRDLAQRLYCRTCKRPFVGTERTPADAVFDIGDDPLSAFMQLHAGGAQNWALRDVLLTWLDRDTPPEKRDPTRMDRLAGALITLSGDYPLLGAILASQLRGDSFREVADELGVSDHTVATMVARLHNVLSELLRAGIAT